MSAAGDKRAQFDLRNPRPWLILIGASALMTGVLFWDAMVNLWVRWGGQQELSHSYFIPVIALWLVWVNRKTIAASVGAPSWIGIGLYAFAGLLLIVGKLLNLFLFQQIGLVFAIAGLVGTFGGASLLRATAVPILFLFFAVPPPFWAITVLSWNFQEISSIIGVAMIRMMDIPVYLSGNVIDLGEYKLQVAEACSGLRYLFPFLSLGVMTAFLFRGPMWQRLAIVVSTIPITIFMNSFRIAVTGALVQAYGTEHAEGALHLFEGWVVFILCLIALLGVVALFTYTSKPRRSPLDALGSPELKQVPPSAGALRRPVAAAAVGAALVVLFGVSSAVSGNVLLTPEREAFAELPKEFPNWRADIVPMDPSVAEVLNADDTIVANVSTEDGRYFNIYLAYLLERGDGRAWHSPRQCIPGGGWQIASHDVLKNTIADGTVINYNRLVIENRNHRQVVYYWYDQRGRDIANEFVMKIWLIYDSLTRKRGDGALVRLITPVTSEGGIEAADRLLLDAMARIEPVLPKYIPE